MSLRPLRAALVLVAPVVFACGGDDTTLRVVRPFMVLDPDPGTPLKYSEVVLGRSTDDPQIIAVQNIGQGPLTLDKVVINGDGKDAFVVSSRPKALVPGGKGEIFVRFDPTIRISASAVLHMETNDPRLPVVEYPLAGGARDPCVLQAGPPNTIFLLGEKRDITITAASTEDCTITYLFTDTDLFPFVDPPALPFVVPAGTSMNLTVEHAATSPEPGVPIRMVSIKESEGTEVTVSVTGEAPLFDCLSVYPFRILFDTTPVGEITRQKITVSNSCTRDAYVTSGETTLGYYYYSIDHVQFPLKIPANGSRDLWVSYSPFSRAGDDGVIVLRTDDTGQPSLKVTLFGRAAVPLVAVFPSVLDFGKVAYRGSSGGTRSQCSSATEYLQVYSDGDAPLTVSSLDFTGDGDFEVTDIIVDGAPVANVTQPFTIPPSKDAKIYLQFYPTRLSPADHTGTLLINHDADNSPFSVTLKGRAVGDGATTDNFMQLSGPKVDILFVIDDSCSMASKQSNLVANLSRFVGYADSEGADYNIAVVDTEGFSPQSGDFERPYCVPQYPRVISSHWADSMTRAAAFDCIFSLGTAGSGIEAGLAAAKNALIKAQDPTRDVDGTNQGFLREDAKLVLVVVSDADDQSHETNQLIRDYFFSVKGPHRHNDVKVHAIAGPVDQPCPPGVIVEGTGYNYYWMTQQTGGQFFNICLQDWSPILTNLGLNVFSPIDEWDLSQQADPGTVVVSVNGMHVAASGTNGYTYDSSTNSVKFNGRSVPPPGATVSVSYDGLCRP